MKFNHLNVPTHWQNYWTRYPEGHTILEALISWVSQVDNMVDNQNKLNDNIDVFVERFDKRLQDEVTNTLTDWQESGFLAVAISEAVQWQLTDYIATNEADKASISTQLQRNEMNVNTRSINVMYPPIPMVGAKGNAKYRNPTDNKYYQDAGYTIPAQDDTQAINNVLRAFDPHVGGNNTDMKMVAEIPAGDFLIEGTVYIRKGQHLKGTGIGSTRILVPTTNKTEPTFKMGYGLVNGEIQQDSGGLAPSISDMSTEGGSLKSAIIDGSWIAGISMYNLFITAAGIGIHAPVGDLSAYNITFDECQVALILEGSRNTFDGLSFFHNTVDIRVTGTTVDTFISNSNLAYAEYTNIEVKSSEVKNLVFSDCNFIGNGQYAQNIGGVTYNGAKNTDIKFNDCQFSNLPGYAFAFYNTANYNDLTLNGCTIDGEKTHPLYVQGTTSKAISVGNNNFKVLNTHFKNLKGDQVISVNGVTGSLLIKDCTWENVNAEHVINLSSTGTNVMAYDNVGDNVTPLINVFPATSVVLEGNKRWLGGIKEGGGKKYVKIPTFGHNFNAIVKVSANTFPAGDYSYRKTALYNVYRYTEYTTSVQNFVKAEQLSGVTSVGYAPAIEIETTLDTVNGASSGDQVSDRYIIIAVPDSWGHLHIDIV